MSHITLRRVTVSRHKSLLSSSQSRHASLLRRPHRPYTFTQLVTLSDGSTYMHRTTSPAPVFKTTKDTRNHILWNPSLSSLRNMEEDEAGRLRAFRNRFGRGWDMDGGESEGSEGSEEGGAEEAGEDREESLMDLISGFAKAKGLDGKEGGKGKK